MQNLKSLLLIAGFGMLLIVGCGKDQSGNNGGSNGKSPKVENKQPALPDPMAIIPGSWKLQKFNMKGQMLPPQIMTTSVFSFSKDGRYEILMGELERGVWKVSPDNKLLITLPDSAEKENHIDILKMEKGRLILSNNQGPNPVTMELVPQ